MATKKAETEVQGPWHPSQGHFAPDAETAKWFALGYRQGIQQAANRCADIGMVLSHPQIVALTELTQDSRNWELPEKKD